MSKVSELESHLGYWLRNLSNHVSHRFACRLADREVTVAEWAMMRVLFDEPPTPPSRLSERMGLTRGAITKLADRLIAKGFVRRRASPDDKRAQTLELTPAGKGIIPELAAIADENEAECFSRMPEADRDNLARILREAVMRLELTAIPID